MLANFVNIWIHAIRVRDHDAKMVDFVKLITAALYQHSNVAVQLDTPRHYVKSPKEMHAIRAHAVMVDSAISNHCTNMIALVHKVILVSPFPIHFLPF